jgi:hypothetical protein
VYYCPFSFNVSVFTFFVVISQTKRFLTPHVPILIVLCLFLIIESALKVCRWNSDSPVYQNFQDQLAFPWLDAFICLKNGAQGEEQLCYKKLKTFMKKKYATEENIVCKRVLIKFVRDKSVTA